jgi:Bacterial capsule synthesis protein PGA_cap
LREFLMGIRETRPVTAVIAGLALVLTAGCSAEAKAPSGTGGGGGGGGAAEPKKGPVTVAFGGDVHFEGALRARLIAAPDAVFGPIAQPLRRADLAMVNLETAITDGGTAAPKQYVFRAPATAFQAMRSAGVDVASMANNHGMDYGEQGLRDSMASARKASFPVVGIGTDAAAAFRPYVKTIKGTKVAIIGATQVLDDNLIQAWTAADGKAGLASAKEVNRLVQEVRAARTEGGADVVIVNLHWGQELNNCATPVQRQLAGQLAAAGADAVIGSHAHVLQAGGYLKGSYVHYGVGNFLFYNANGRTAQSGVLTLTFDPNGKPSRVTKADWAPAVLEAGVARPLSGPAAQQARSEWEALRRCADVTAAPGGQGGATTSDGS